MSATPEGSFVVATDHAALEGHFPGCPIVPGVVLLDEVFACLRLQGRVQLERARFLAPVAPGAVVRVFRRPAGAGRIGFAGQVCGSDVVVGEVRFAPDPAIPV